MKKLIPILLILTSCARTVVVEREEAMRIGFSPKMDSVVEDRASLIEGIQGSIQSLKKRSEGTLTFGQCKVQSNDYINFLEKLLLLPDESRVEYLKDTGNWYEVYGKSRYGEILLTSYYSPLYEARRKPEGRFLQPIFALPNDLIEVNLSSFNNEELAQLDTDRSIVMGRIYDRGPFKRVVPYYSREDIDINGALEGRQLELAYLDPIDAFFLQIQGSGTIEFKNGQKQSIGYAGQNGYRYKSIGKDLYHIIPQEEMSMGRIRDHLKTLDKSELYKFLISNPSYVFFRKIKSKGITTFGPEVIPLRTLAVDYKVFPLGAMGFLEFERPFFSDKTKYEPSEIKKEQRFVFAHDTGGAIKGPGRADLYWGEGAVAGQAAGYMRHSAKLWFLAPKKCQNTQEEI